MVAAEFNDLLNAPTIMVTLDLFSGLPNPSWELGPAQRNELRNRLSHLTSLERERVRVPGLGYRGLVLSQSRGSGASDDIRIFGGAITPERAGTRSYKDSGSRLEAWLLSTGRTAIDPDLYRELSRHGR